MVDNILEKANEELYSDLQCALTHNINVCEGCKKCKGENAGEIRYNLMTKLKNKMLCDKYPYLLPRNVWNDSLPEDYDYSYIKDAPDGWNDLFMQMCEDIRQPLIDANYLEEFRFMEIKEKYGQLRVYTNGVPQEVANIISKYEYLSQFVCIDCGKPATYETRGWIVPLCEDCLRDDSDCEKIEFNPAMRYTKYDSNGVHHVEVDCSDEWNRLMRVE